jgi:hypothetical protein
MHGMACIEEWTLKRHVLRWDWNMCSKV